MWHYSTFTWKTGDGWGGLTGDPGVEAMLQRKGNDGWELVTVTLDRDDTMRFYFKQPA
jgi:hypothetical protein